MKVSIIIPCFNLGKYLKEAVDSVESQTFSDWEIIIVDDGSTDKLTVDLIKRIKSKNTRVYRIRNRKLPGARNYGISKAKGEYIVCLDADDKLAPTFLEKTAKILDKDVSKQIGFVTTWLQEFGERSTVWETSDYNVPKLLISNVVHVASMFRKDTWKKVGGYNETLTDEGIPLLHGYEDWDMWLRMVERGYRWEVVSEPLFLYRIRKNSMLSISRESHLDLYRRIYSFHKDLFLNNSEGFVLESAYEMNQLRNSLVDKDEAIKKEASYREKYRKQVENLTVEVNQLQSEMTALKTSRIVGPAIKMRSIIKRAKNGARKHV